MLHHIIRAAIVFGGALVNCVFGCDLALCVMSRLDTLLQYGVHARSMLDDNPWTFILTGPVNIETAFIAKKPADHLQKMTLARHIQLSKVLSDSSRDNLWKMESRYTIITVLLLVLLLFS